MSALAILENFGYYADAVDVSPLYNALDKKIKASASGMKVKKMLDAYEATAIGKIAPDIKQQDTLGNAVSLSSFRGKYVMVDFWASWCGPCRQENPNVVVAYNRFKNKNFTILGISLDQDKDAWQAAIAKDNLTWNHMSDLKQWQSEAVMTYGFEGIPFNVLIDPTGKIIASGLRGEDLGKKLEEVLK